MADHLDQVLGQAVDHLAVSDTDLVADVRAGIESRSSTRGRIVAAAAVVVAAVIVGSLAFDGPREALADLFGIGDTTITDEPPPEPPRSQPLPSSAPDRDLFTDLGLTEPAGAGAPVSAASSSELTIVVYDGLTLEVRPLGTSGTAKIPALGAETGEGGEFVRIDRSTVQPDGLWVEGDHVRVVDGDTLTSASALVWTLGDNQLRLEGDLELESMLAIARTIRPR